MNVLGRTVNLEQVAFVTQISFHARDNGHFSIYFSGGAEVRLEWPARLNGQAHADYHALTSAISARDAILYVDAPRLSPAARPRLHS